MNLVLIIVLIVLGIFVIAFIVGMVKASILGSNKRRYASALVVISQLSDIEREVLIDVYNAHKEKNLEKVNKIVESLDKTSLQSLLDICDPKNRPVDFSAGMSGNNLSWTVMEKEFQRVGYNEYASIILSGIIFNHYDDVLNKIAKN